MNAFYIPDHMVDHGGDSTIESFAVHLPSIETVGLPPIECREVPFPKCAFRQSPHKNNIDIACENKNQTSLSFPYLSFCQVLDSFLGISLLLQTILSTFLPVDSIFKTLFPGEVLTGIRALADYLS
jgi:hypothetical protein